MEPQLNPKPSQNDAAEDGSESVLQTAIFDNEPGSAGFQPASADHPCASQNVQKPELNASIDSPPAPSMTLLSRFESYLKHHQFLSLITLPVLILTYLWLTNPFRDELVREVYSLSSLSASQQYNIDLASRALDGRVLKPGELFSFNRTVGPRQGNRGYRAAPVYVGPNSPDSVGGGICLVSSVLYQAALSTGWHS